MHLLLDLAALIALVPMVILSLRSTIERDTLYWTLLAVAVAGPVARSVIHAEGGWDAGFSAALWLSVTACLVVFAVLAAITRHAWRLTPLVAGYLILTGVLGTILEGARPAPSLAGTAVGWLGVHILVSLATYALVTLGAIAAIAAFVQERALKQKHRSALSRLLPSVAEGERLLIRLLAVGEATLAAGLLSGMSLYALAGKRWLSFDHRTLFSLLALAVIGLLLFAHWRWGLRGRLVARIVLSAWLLLTLAYPGVKFVTDILLDEV